MFDLSGKSALVTGASGGIGGAIAKALHGAGATVGLSGTREAPLQELAAELGERAHVLPCNLSDLDAVEALPKQAAEAMGRALAECVASRRASPSLGVVLRRCAHRQPPPPSLRARCCCNRSVWGLRSGLARPARRDAADQR